MKYFIDTEFHEYHKQVKCCGIKIGKLIPTIDLISIGIVAEDGREYYAISKDFNIKDAWNSFQIKVSHNLFGGQDYKEYWLRDNVLFPIYTQFISGDNRNRHDFSISTMKMIIKNYGKTNKEIAKEVIEFCKEQINERDDNVERIVYNKTDIDKEYPRVAKGIFNNRSKPEFYGYYSDYDWVVFCQLFGKMIDLPDGFPYYCIDLQQTKSEKDKTLFPRTISLSRISNQKELVTTLKEDIRVITQLVIEDCINYPKQVNEHNALADAKWTYELYKFLNTL